MTEYKGSNIGLNYDAATGTWGFTNEPQSFVDVNAFSTTDVSFPYVEPDTDAPEDETPDPCPPGYIYDRQLKQCVPDPDYQNPFSPRQQDTVTNDPNRDNPQAEFIEFDASTESGRKFMFDHAVKKGYVDQDGNLLGPPKAPTLPMGMTAVAQFGINRQYNRWLKELGKYDAEMKAKGLPTGFAQAIGYAKILSRFYETTSATQLRGRDVDVSDDATIKTTDKTVDTSVTLDDDLDSQITETKAGEPVDIISDIRDSKSGTSYTDASGDTYTSTGDGGIKFEPKVSKPAVSQKTKGGVSYGTGRGGTASAQRQMKKQSAPSSAAESFKQYGRF
jgi:hypothetical protein